MEIKMLSMLIAGIFRGKLLSELKKTDKTEFTFDDISELSLSTATEIVTSLLEAKKEKDEKVEEETIDILEMNEFIFNDLDAFLDQKLKQRKK